MTLNSSFGSICKSVLIFQSIRDAQYQKNMANKNNDYDYMQEQVAEEYDGILNKKGSLMHMVKFYR
jgi:hypothetical protein